MREPLRGDAQARGLDVGLLGCPPRGQDGGGARHAIRAKVPLAIGFVMPLGGDARGDLQGGLCFADAQLQSLQIAGPEPLEPLIELATQSREFGQLTIGCFDPRREHRPLGDQLLVTATIERRVGDHRGDVAARQRRSGCGRRDHDLTFDRGMHGNDPRIDPRLAGDAKTNCGPRDHSPIASSAMPARILTHRQTCAGGGLRQRDAPSATSPAMRRSRGSFRGASNSAVVNARLPEHRRVPVRLTGAWTRIGLAIALRRRLRCRSFLLARRPSTHGHDVPSRGP